MSPERELKSLANKLAFYAPRLLPLFETVEQTAELASNDLDLGEAARSCIAAIEELQPKLEELADVLKARRRGASKITTDRQDQP